MLPLPSVYGMKVDKAQKTLQDAGFQVNVVYAAVHFWNQVMSQNPEGGDGKTAPRNSVVTINVS